MHKFLVVLPTVIITVNYYYFNNNLIKLECKLLTYNVDLNVYAYIIDNKIINTNYLSFVNYLIKEYLDINFLKAKYLNK